jgi:hypothetical protein
MNDVRIKLNSKKAQQKSKKRLKSLSIIALYPMPLGMVLPQLMVNSLTEFFEK